MKPSPEIQRAVHELVDNLRQGRHAELERDGRAGRLSAAELEQALRDYGRTLIELPAEAWLEADSYDVSPTESSYDIPLWTAEEGRSDLTLSVTVVRGSAGPTVAIEDLHVL